MPSQSEPQIEAAIFVRIDHMDAEQTIGQRSIRIELDVQGLEQLSVNDFVAKALEQAPPVDSWDRY
jgi:hypothetical protein